MSDKKTRYFTTTLPYVNANPHVGHALEFVHADVTARAARFSGVEVFLNIGTDEHGLKIYRKAKEVGKKPQEYVDDYAARFRSFAERLGVNFDAFIRTTDPTHKEAAQEFWRRCYATGDIYKKQYAVKYCVGCELEKTDSELEDGHCPVHPNLAIEHIEEENYFFRFSKYQDALLQLYEGQPDFVLPDSRLHEIKKFVGNGLEDFSISRLKDKMPWGVPVPDDEEHVMYVWFDALVNYISTIGWPQDLKTFEKWWPVVQFAGKDNLRQQSAMWQAMLMSAGIAPSKQVIIHGFITSEGQKMSKSLGNVIDPVALMDEYGTDALRYYLARHVHPFEDSDMTEEKFKEAYTANLANGLGNVASRILALAESHLEAPVTVPADTLPQEFLDKLAAFQVQRAADSVWERIGALDKRIQNEQPFALVKTDSEKAKKIISEVTIELHAIACMLTPLLPETSKKIKEAVRANRKPEPLFVRK